VPKGDLIKLLKNDKDISLQAPKTSGESTLFKKRGLSSDSKIVKNLRRDFVSKREQSKNEEKREFSEAML